MARMYPRELPRHVLDNPKLSSEVRVYERMRDKLPGDFNCYYSRSRPSPSPWSSRRLR